MRPVDEARVFTGRPLDRLSRKLRFHLGRWKVRWSRPIVVPHRLAAAALGWGTHPDFIIVGAQKAGTKSLHRYLMDHPSVRRPIRKEVHFFDLEFARGEQWYQAHFPLRIGGRSFITGEASPYYLFHPLVPARVAALLPDVPLIVLLRDPVERAFSHYRHNVKFGLESESFETALRREEELLPAAADRVRAGAEDPSGLFRHGSYVARGRYAQQLERWFELFPTEQICILKSEELFARPHEVVEVASRFLGIEPVARRDYPVFNRGLDGSMDPRIREALAKRFEADNRRLIELTGMEFPEWT